MGAVLPSFVNSSHAEHAMSDTREKENCKSE
jgi:hypothetical protein